ncbi:MAG: alpha/beta hydrolase [Clostridia bacterium]|nr:alpha/beta hydrolase [Clostridia bacterium]
MTKLSSEINPVLKVQSVKVIRENSSEKVELFTLQDEEQALFNAEVLTTGNMTSQEARFYIPGSCMENTGMLPVMEYSKTDRNISISPTARGLSDSVKTPSAQMDCMILEAIALNKMNNGEIKNIKAVVGYSRGGIIALNAGIRNVLPIEAIIVMNSTGQFKGDELIVQVAKTLTPEQYSIAGLLALTFGSGAADSEKAEMSQRFIALNSEVPATTGISDLKDATAACLNELLRKMPIPTLFIANAEDAIVPIESTRATAAIMPNASVVEFEAAGHLDFYRLGSEYEQKISEFLSQAR